MIPYGLRFQAAVLVTSSLPHWREITTRETARRHEAFAVGLSVMPLHSGAKSLMCEAPTT
jgi:hypothetical protein